MGSWASSSCWPGCASASVKPVPGCGSAAVTMPRAIAVAGHAAAPEDLVRRSGAAPGDSGVLAGRLGGAAAGLRLLQEPSLGEQLEADVASMLRLRQLEPWPRLAEGAMLAAAGATAMIDLSDGLGADAERLAAASGVRLRTALATGPRQAGARTLASA